MIHNVKSLPAIQCLQEFILASVLASNTTRADITGESPFVNPNWRDDCSNVCFNRGNKTLSNSFPVIAIKAILLTDKV